MIALTAAAPNQTSPIASIKLPDSIAHTSLRSIASNVGVATLLVAALLPIVQHDFFAGPTVQCSLSDMIWLGGGVLMGALCLIRLQPSCTMIDVRSIIATTGMIAVPMLMRPGVRSVGWIAALAFAVQTVGMLVSQVSRLYLGRRFALLPANRGIVRRGPFRAVRHPVYAGWLILAAGYVMAYPSWLNGATFLLTLPLMMWRINLEEHLLNGDAVYSEYCQRTPYRLIPGFF
ncbi:MAG TPA: isoprenylcysteine carboxylmethyltransferase family protein [Candidatus Binataceae bacterium]|nr:isoprenylcysteine carboxylmethyltransferase family protein [Candidatus Binataceae bacterium]